MAKYCGKDLLIQRLKTAPSTYETIASMRSTSFSVNNEEVDVTDKSSVPWKQLLQCGVRSMALSASGIFSNDVSHDDLMSDVTAGNIVQFKIISGRGDYFVGQFLVTSLERSGEYNGAEQFSLSLSSAGAVTYTAGV